MKRVLFVSQVFPPMIAGGVPRVGRFAKYLPENGWAVSVLTGVADAQKAASDGLLAELPSAVDVIRAQTPFLRVGARGSQHVTTGWAGLKRAALRKAASWLLVPDRHMFWIKDAVTKGLAAVGERPHHAILATYGPGSNLVVGYWIAKKSGLPLVVDYRDLWVDLPYHEFPTPLHKSLLREIEGRVIRKASKVVAVSQRMADHLVKAYGQAPDKAVCVTNGYASESADWVYDQRAFVSPGSSADPEDLGEGTQQPERPFRLCYAGSVYGPYDLGPFFEVVATLQSEGVVSPADLRLHFVGNLPQDLVERCGVQEFVESDPFVPHRQVFDAFAKADALMMIEGLGYWAEYSYAVKVFDYALTGKPVLGLVEKEGNSGRLLTQLQVGHLARPDDRAGIRKALLAILALKGAPARQVDLETGPLAAFNRRRLTRDMAQVLDSVI